MLLLEKMLGLSAHAVRFFRTNVKVFNFFFIHPIFALVI